MRLHGHPLPRLRSRKGQWLLALLTLRHGREVERSWIAGTLWPDSPEPQALAVFQELGDKSGIDACLKELGGGAESRRQPERAARLYAAAQALREAMGASLPPSDY